MKDLRLLRPFFAGREAAQRALVELAELRHDLVHIRRAVEACEHSLDLIRRSEEDPGEAYFRALRGVGVLNYQNATVSGEKRFLKNFATQMPDAVVFDVGANTGQFAATLRAAGARGALHCFEPHPVSHAALAARAAALHLVPHALALGDAEGEIEVFDYADEAGSQHASVYRGVIEGIHHRPAAATRVGCTTVDAMAARLGLAHIGLLKVDTEGHELAVLRGAQGLLAAGAIDVVQFEFNEMNVISRVFMKDFFDILPNYRLCRLLPDRALEFQIYDPRFMEVFAYQNIACIRRDLDPHWLMSG